jgi:sugar phosphate isomerase/epimerase
MKLALHTWTLDTTPLGDVLRIIRETGWDGVELRRVDFLRAAEAGEPAERVLERVRASGVPVACVGVELGWMWARGADRKRLLEVFDEQCARAEALGCATVMSASDRGRGDLREAADNVRAVGDIAARHGVRVAVEFNSQAEHFNALGPMRELLAVAGHPRCGLLLDAYHLQRSGGKPGDIDDMTSDEIAYVQFSDVPRTGLVPGAATDRLPPGTGSVPFPEFFNKVAAKGYAGYASYEAPNPQFWSRPAPDVAREALTASRAAFSRT